VRLTGDAERIRSRFAHIVIEGPIGVGKTSLARKLGELLGAELLAEQAQDNPFLDRFYADRPGYALQTQLFFLLQRVKQVQTAAQTRMFDCGLVSDFLFAKDDLFARLNLSDEEYRLYAQLHARVAPPVPEPDLVIWLQASPATLLQRVQRRGIDAEQRIESDYLRRLSDAYARFFQTYDGAPLLAVDTEEFNPLDDAVDFERLLAAMAGFQGRRDVLDPHARPPWR